MIKGSGMLLRAPINIGRAHNRTTGEVFEIQPPSDVLDILRMGGIQPFVKRHLHEMEAK